MKKKKKNNNNNRFDYYTEAKAKYWNGKVAWGVGVLLRGTGKGSIKEFEIHPKNIYVPKLNEPI